MKKIMLLIFCTVLLLGSISAFEFDNKLTYSNNDLKVDFDNLFGLGEHLGSAELKSHPSVEYIKEVGAGNGIVMWYDFKDFKEIYENGLGEVVFTNESNGEIIERDYSFVYWGDKERNIYGEGKCNTLINGTQICERIIIGTETYQDWLPYNSKDIPKENIRIGLKTYVEVGDYMDGVWTIVGKKIKKHSVWTASLNVGLVSFWSFDGSSSLTIRDNKTGAFNGTIDSLTSRVIPGFLGNSYKNNKTELYDIDFASIPPIADKTSYSISSWINDTDIASNSYYFNLEGATTDDFILMRVSNDQPICTIRTSGNTADANSNVTISSGTWNHMVCVREGTVVKLYLNDVYVGTGSNGALATFSDVEFNIGSSGTHGDDSLSWDGELDLIGVWNRSISRAEITQLYNVGSGISFTRDFSSDKPIVTNTFPTNETIFTDRNIITFNGTASDDQDLVNVSRYLDGVLIETNSSGFNDTNYIFTSSALSEGNHDWFYSAWDNETQQTNGTGMRFTINTVDPIVIIHNPTNNTFITNYTKVSTTTVIINATSTDTNLNVCWIDYLNTTNATITCNANKTLTGEPFSINTYRIWANDTFGRTGHADRTATFDFNILERSTTSNDPVIEGSTESYSIKFNISNSLTPSSANVTYNGTDYLATITGSANPYLANVSFTIPLVSSLQIFNFTWNLLLSDSIYYSSEVFTQNVTGLGVDDCSSFTTLLYNITVVDEENQTLLTNPSVNATIEINLDFFDLSRSTEIFNYSNISIGINPLTICLNSALLSSTEYSLDTTIKYQAPAYSIEYYHIENFTIKNSTLPQNITLFDLKIADATEFQITFKDSNFNTVEGALVFIQRQYISENNTFKTVELPKTDSNGQTLGHFVEKDVIYNIIVTNGISSEILGVFNNIIAFCQDATIGDCVINLNALASGEIIFDYETETGVALTNPIYEGTSRLLSMDFLTFDGTSKTVNMSGIVFDQLGSNTACTSQLTSASGTLSCTVPSSFGNSSLRIFVFVEGDLVIVDYVPIDTKQTYGDAGYLILFFMILTLVMMFLDSKTGVLVALIIGLIVGGAYSLITADSIGIGASIMWIIIAVGFMVWKLNKEKG